MKVHAMWRYMPSKRYRWHRHPKTTQERRKSDDKEIGGFVRAKRNKRNLANACDDISIPYRNHINWKRLRKTQYKAKPSFPFGRSCD